MGEQLRETRSRPRVPRLGVSGLVALVLASVLVGIVVSTATGHVPTCGVNSVGGRVVCHTGINDNNLYAKNTSPSGFCPSDFHRIGSVAGFDNIFAGGVCDSNARSSSNFFCVGCRPTTISIDNPPSRGQHGGLRRMAWQLRCRCCPGRAASSR